MAAGYIYVLVNSSMPGLVKVGKTTRTPSDRADELSGVSGVATPFIVAYEDHFDDCDAAELFVHTKLAVKGMRVSESREFFRAPVSDVVKIIASAGAPTKSRPSSGENDDLLTPDDNEFKDYQIDHIPPPPPWEEILKRADCYYFGVENCIEDRAEALKLYRDAARLGSALAFESLGLLYERGHGTRVDEAKALDYFKEGAKKGNPFCYARMAELFVRTRHVENARKSFAKFIAEGEARDWKSYQKYDDRHIWEMLMTLYGMCRANMFSELDQHFRPMVRKYQTELIIKGKECIGKYSEDKDGAEAFANVVQHLEAQV